MRAYDWSAECPVQKMATGGYYVRNDDCPGLLCVTCKEPFGKRRSPRILPCSHVFCLPCLIALEASAVAIQLAFSPSADCQQTDSDNDKSLSSDGTKVTDDDIAGSIGARQDFVFLCPTCRTRVSVPEGGVGYFPYNMYMTCGIPGDDSPVQTGNPLVLAQEQHQGAVSSLQHCGATKTLSIAELANKLDLLENHVTQNGAEIAQIKTDLKETETVVAETKKDLEADVTQNKTDVVQVKTDLKKTEADVAQNKADVAQMKTDLKKTETGVAQNKADVAHNKTDVEQIKTDLKKTETGVAQNKADVAHNKTDVEQIKTDLKKTETGVAQNKADVAQNKTDVVQIKTDLKKTETGVVQNKADVAHNKTDVEQIKTDLKKTETGVAQNKTDVAQIDADLKKIELGVLQIRFNLLKTDQNINAANSQMKEHADKLAKAGRMVAFNAWFIDEVKTNKNQPIVFKNITVNEGGCFNKTTGVFTAPVKGTYVFGASVAKKEGESGYVEATLMVGAREHAVFSGSSTSQGSSSISLQLDVGQRLWLKAHDKSDDYDDHGYMSFTGALVQPEL